jgi:hypothetical protein
MRTIERHPIATIAAGLGIVGLAVVAVRALRQR